MTKLEFLLRTARALASTSPEKATNFVLNSLGQQLIHGYDILSGQHCPRLSTKMQPLLVSGSAALASTNALDAGTN